MPVHISRKQNLYRQAAGCGLSIGDQCPDGQTRRYRFFAMDTGIEPIASYNDPTTHKPVATSIITNYHDYAADDHLYTALGISEAETWLDGYSQCYYHFMIKSKTMIEMTIESLRQELKQQSK